MYKDNPYISQTEQGFFVLEESPKSPPYLVNKGCFEIKDIDTSVLEKLIDLHKQNKVFELTRDTTVYVYDKDEYEKSKELHEEYNVNYLKYNEARNLIKQLNESYNIPKEFSDKLINLQRKIDDLEKENEWLRKTTEENN